MPGRFYFHLIRGSERVVDRVGLVVPDAVVMSPAVVDKIKERWPGTADLTGWDEWSVEITDATGNVVRTIALL